jgi:serine protease AprX
MKKLNVGHLVVLGGCVACSSASVDSEVDERKSSTLTAVTEDALQEGTVFEVEIAGSEPVSAVFHPDATSEGNWVSDGTGKEDMAPTSAEPPVKISPTLLAKSGDLEVIIQLTDDYQLPRMPRLGADESRDSETWTDKAAVIDAEIEKARTARARTQDPLARRLQQAGARVHDRLWIINAITATVDASLLDSLAADDTVERVAPSSGGGGLAAADIVVGRNAMNSDPYYNTSGLASGWIALLDSGIRGTHQVLSTQTSWVRDCVNGWTSNCSVAGTGLTLDPSDQTNHGTGVASIMSGNASLGSNNRGVTDIKMDSFRVFASNGAVDYGAVGRGFQAAVAGGDNVVNASFDCYDSSCTDAANNAFDAGLVVIAAAGNTGGTAGNRIGDPANGKKVLAIAALEPTSLNRASYSATGPASDNRTKPELAAVGGSSVEPLNLARRTSDSAFGDAGMGTSYASPFVTGGAGLLSRWLKVSLGATSIEPGLTNAMLLASGINYSSPIYDNNIGAGRLVLPTSAVLYGSKITITNGQTVDTTISIAAGVSTIDATIWWPEGTTHNDVDLQLIRPDGTSAGSSGSSSQVWEKVHASTSTSGNWKIRAYGFSVTGSQTVYVAGIRR